jgi:serine/threonine protein kinase
MGDREGVEKGFQCGRFLGLGRRFSVTIDSRGLCTGGVGTPGYTSPECLSGKPYDGRKSDVWSLGLILCAMVVGRLPWDTTNQRQIANQIKSGRFEIPSIYGSGFARVMQSILATDVKKRCSVKDLLHRRNKKRNLMMMMTTMMCSGIE